MNLNCFYLILELNVDPLKKFSDEISLPQNVHFKEMLTVINSVLTISARWRRSYPRQFALDWIQGEVAERTLTGEV